MKTHLLMLPFLYKRFRVSRKTKNCIQRRRKFLKIKLYKEDT